MNEYLRYEVMAWAMIILGALFQVVLLKFAFLGIGTLILLFVVIGEVRKYNAEKQRVQKIEQAYEEMQQKYKK